MKDGDFLSIIQYGYPLPFIFDGKPSEVFGLTIAFQEVDPYSAPSGSGLEQITDSINNSAEQYIFAEKQTPVLEFPIEFFGDKMDVFHQRSVKEWLFGQNGYKKLQICMDNYSTIYFNCKIKTDTDYIAGSPYGLRCTIVCDSPYAWEFPKTKHYYFPNHQYYDCEFFNMSSDLNELYPLLKFKLAPASNGITIINKSDHNREFKFKNLMASEEITVDNKSKIITSSTGLSRFDNFNKKFFRLKRGFNHLQIVGACEYLSIIYQNNIRIGGGIH